MSIAFRFVTSLLTVVLAGALTACASTPPATVTLYDRLGGAVTVQAIAARVIDGFATAPDGARAFDRVKLPRVKRGLGEFLCVLADGPCHYSGDDMKVVHAGLNISEREFNALVEHLRATLDALDVPQGAKNELLRRLAPMRRDIVSAAATAPPGDDG
jgi:hemoglobin